MNRSKQQILFLVIALAIGVSFPYLLDMAGRALEPQTSAPIGDLTPAQRLESACVAVQQLNTRLNRKDPDRLSFFGELKGFRNVRPELQEIHRLVCGK
jgi:hypothetical protein